MSNGWVNDELYNKLVISIDEKLLELGIDSREVASDIVDEVTTLIADELKLRMKYSVEYPYGDGVPYWVANMRAGQGMRVKQRVVSSWTRFQFDPKADEEHGEQVRANLRKMIKS